MSEQVSCLLVELLTELGAHKVADLGGQILLLGA